MLVCAGAAGVWQAVRNITNGIIGNNAVRRIIGFLQEKLVPILSHDGQFHTAPTGVVPE
jgi:hypothetical protein